MNAMSNTIHEDAPVNIESNITSASSGRSDFE